MFEHNAITTSSCVRPGRRPVCRSSVSLLTCMIRSTHADLDNEVMAMIMRAEPLPPLLV